MVLERFGGIEMTFQIGDRVREGTHIGTVTDVGTVLIQVRSDAGGLRVVCPWDLAKILDRHHSHDGTIYREGGTVRSQ
jgi:small-conductance mechanosensitive channel